VTGRLITARELADRLGVTAETVPRWARRGELPAIKLPLARSASASRT
jgi:predicted site-specific integrase-resolvase